MAFEAHGFMRDEKWYEDLGHVLLGFLPLDLLWYTREWTTARLLWPFKGQWPPGDPVVSWKVTNQASSPYWRFSEGDADAGEVLRRDVDLTQMARVADKDRDEFGRSIGAQLRVLILIGLLAWRW